MEANSHIEYYLKKLIFFKVNDGRIVHFYRTIPLKNSLNNR